jgi:hypothetical protein
MQDIHITVPETVVSVASSMEELRPGLVRYWLMDRRIVVFKATQATREVVNVWVEKCKSCYGAVARDSSLSRHSRFQRR